jgi:hypothetical protein
LFCEVNLIKMSILTIHPKNDEQEKALKTIFDAFNIRYEKELDATEYLMSTEANRKALDESIQQLEAGKGVKVSLEDLWK